MTTRCITVATLTTCMLWDIHLFPRMHKSGGAECHANVWHQGMADMLPPDDLRHSYLNFLIWCPFCESFLLNAKSQGMLSSDTRFVHLMILNVSKINSPIFLSHTSTFLRTFLCNMTEVWNYSSNNIIQISLIQLHDRLEPQWEISTGMFLKT